MNKHLTSLFLTAALALCGAIGTSSAADPDLIGKTVIIKTTKEGTSCIRLVDFLPKIGAFNKSMPETCSFKVAEGAAPGTISFESVQQPGFFLRHSSFHLMLGKGAGDDASFRVVSPLRGNEGVSLQSFNFPTHHLTVVEKGQLDIAKDLKDPRKAVFFVQEPPR